MATEDARKLFVAGLPESITEEVLRDLFLATGAQVVNVSLPKDRTTGRPRGFGFVTLSTPEEAESARQALDGSIQAGRSISVRPFSSEPPRRGEPRSDPRGGGGGGEPSAGPPAAGEDRTLYVGNLPYDTSQAEVEQLFADKGAGPVVRVHLPAGPDGRLRGFGFVTLANGEAANAALAALRDADVRGRRLMINIAHPRGSGGGGGGSGPRSGPYGGGPRSDGPRGFDPGFLPPGMESARPVEGRRVRGQGGGGERSGGGEGGGGEDWKKKKKKRGAGAAEKPKEPRTNWQRWEDWDED
jgi:nucleolin